MAEYGKKPEERDDSKDKELLEEAREQFQQGDDGWNDTKVGALDDLRFGRLGQQWPVDIERKRKDDGRPCLTINDLPASIRQVVNDGRQNRPQIKVSPVDNGADVETAEVIGGIIKHIERISNADVAYDLALESAASARIGYIGADIDYAGDDTFDLDIKIEAFANPLSVTGDPNTKTVDSSDWRFAFVTEKYAKKDFEKEFPDADTEGAELGRDSWVSSWFTDDDVFVRRWYQKKENKRKILLLTSGLVVDVETYIKDKALFDKAGETVEMEREVPSFMIYHRLITGSKVLEERCWKGSIIPVVPVYGEMINEEGKWHLKSMVTDAKDAQMMFNLSRSTLSEIVGRSPKTPWIGEEGTFTKTPEMAERWAAINSDMFPWAEYAAGKQPPQRPSQPSLPDGLMQDIMGAADDKKRIIGIHDAGLGLPGKEVSGKAIRYRQHENDTSTFHLTDNLHRAIRCLGQVVVQMIPQVYTGERIQRIIGTDRKEKTVRLGPLPVDPTTRAPIPPAKQPINDRVFDITIGKYDVAVDTGPSYTTKRQESADQLTSYVQAAPAAAPILGPVLVQLADMPEGDKISKMLATMMPPAARAIWEGTEPPPPGPPPEVLQAQEKAKAEFALAQQKAALEAQLEAQRAEERRKLEREQAMADAAVQREKFLADRQLALDKFALDKQLAQDKAALDAQLKREAAALDAELRRQAAASEQDMAMMKELLSAHKASQVPQPTPMTVP